MWIPSQDPDNIPDIPDAYAGQRLPDIPHDGMQTRREKELHDVIQQFCREMERDRICLLSIVIDGKHKWRKVAKDKCAGLRISDDLCDEIFAWFVAVAGPNPMMQRDSLLRLSQVSPIQKVMRDTERYRVLPTRPILKRR